MAELRERKARPGRTRYRAPDKIRKTSAFDQLYKFIVKPFLTLALYKPEERLLKEGLEVFFGTARCRVVFCKALVRFKLPGDSWVSEGNPRVVVGIHPRDVRKGDLLTVRLDGYKFGRNEVEHKGNVFVLTDAQLGYLQEKIKVVV